MITFSGRQKRRFPATSKLHLFRESKPDPPKDVRIHVIDRTAKISWTIPSNIEGATYSRIIIKDSKGRDLYLKGSLTYKDILFPETSFEVANLKLCSEYSVKLQFLSPYSEITTQKFWMTNNNFTAGINQNISLSWTTSLKDFFSVLPPVKSPVIYQVQGGFLVSNNENNKYIFDNRTHDVKAIHVKVIRVNKADAGLYGTESETTGNMDGCCLLIVTDGPENVVLEPAITNINVTEGTALDPIYCIATCNPRCKYNWKQKWTGKFKSVPNKYISRQGQVIKIPAIKEESNRNLPLPDRSFYRQDWIQYTTVFCTNRAFDEFQCLTCEETALNNQTHQHYFQKRYSPKITDIWFSSGNQRKRVRTPETFSFNEEENAKMTLRVESNPDSKIMFRSSLLKIQQINKGNEYTDYTCNLPSLKCEDSGNFSILASNGIPYGDTSIVNLKIQFVPNTAKVIYSWGKPRNVPPESRTIGAKIDTVENMVLQVISFPAPTVKWVSRTGSIWKVQKDRYDYRHKIHSKIRIGSERDFGVYGIRICNQLGCIVENITLKPQDKPEAPQNFTVVTTTFRSVNISWIAGFNGGHEQTFSVQFKATDDVTWNTKNVENNDIKTGSTVYYTLDQLKPDTSYQVVVVSTNLQGQRNASLEFKTEVEPTVKSPLKSASMTPIFIGIGCGIALILIVVTSLYVFCIRRNRGSTNVLESTESNVLYAAVDKIQQKIKRRNPENENEDSNAPTNAEYASVVKPKSKSKKVHYKEDEIEKENDEYAVVDKSNKKIHYTENANVHSNQGNADLLIHQPLKTKPSGRSKNQDGLTYIEVSFTRKPKDRRRIIGAENRTNYVDIDFTRKADPLPESSDE
ncbi:unnamed protein product [Mytilus edulis]|uniref:Fibronectin type-III domain-containing protein n=1 Tax=Mytilus edulis TaxID=6550 RepID=A0A8S3SCR7_MYTED|nr:unnamed protein product [Mytilus edulis]